MGDHVILMVEENVLYVKVNGSTVGLVKLS